MDDRLIEIETKLAYLEDMVTTLNDLVAEQQKHIDQLEIKKALLEEQIEILLENQEDIPQRRPPHY
ncbi:MAG: SlyX family protein [Sphaerochaetaceae bacterium]|nr:SlyX family protein [Sphaerochaetaceae bacterium]MDC7248068.1 SlyX family protein [Sphaerochaetaceae bacterium]